MARRAGTKTQDGAAPRGPAASGTRPPGSRAEYVYEVLRSEILNGTLPPGAPVPQDEIATRLAVSITPVREALRRLESAGLVTYQTHFGATVTELTQDAADELYLLRAAVEGLGARLAASRITENQLNELRTIHEGMKRAHRRRQVSQLAESSRQFHAIVAEAGGPALIAGHLRWIWESYPVPNTESVWQFDDIATDALDEHAQLIDTLAKGDENAAQRLMQQHLGGVAAKRQSHKQRP